MPNPGFKYYKGRRHGKTMYFHILGAAGPMIGSIYYRPSEGWEYFYEISREAYAKAVPPIVFEQLEEDPHPYTGVQQQGLIAHF